jgi:TonB-dependent receptor
VTPFYKDIDSFIVGSTEQRVIVGDNLLNDAGEDVSGQTFTVSLPINGTGGKLYGVELGYQQPFSFLPVDGFGIMANLTLTESEGDVTQGGVTTTQALEGQSDESYNLVGYYDSDRFSVRLAYSFRGEYVRAYRGGNLVGDVPHTQYIDDRSQLDVSARYHLNDNVSFYLDAINLNSEDYYFYDVLPAMSGDYFVQGAVYNFGVRAQF